MGGSKYQHPPEKYVKIKLDSNTTNRNVSQRLTKADSAKTDHHNLHDEIVLITGLLH